MAGLKPHECFRRIKPINLDPVLAVVCKLEFADSGGKCAWVTKRGSIAPPELIMLVRDCGLGGEAKRLFCRKLMPRQCIAPHVDDWIPSEIDWRRFHIPLITHPSIVMRWPADEIEVHLEPGFLWEVRYDRLHEVVNNADCERIHVQIDQANATI
jgi:hypothetical protein